MAVHPALIPFKERGSGQQYMLDCCAAVEEQNSVVSEGLEGPCSVYCNSKESMAFVLCA